MFELQSATAFDVTTRNYADYIKEFNIEFLVMTKTGLTVNFSALTFATSILNEKYVICRIKK